MKKNSRAGTDIAHKVSGGVAIVVGFSGDSLATQHAEAGCDLSWSKSITPDVMLRELRLCCTAASPLQQQAKSLSPKAAESDTPLPAPLLKRPFGLEAVHEQFGAEQYGIICAILVKQGSSDIAALKANLATLNWKESQRVSHKIKGTVLSLSLTCCADAIALDLALKRQVAEGDAEGESVALGAVFVEAFDAVLAYITSHPT